MVAWHYFTTHASQAVRFVYNWRIMIHSTVSLVLNPLPSPLTFGKPAWSG